MLARWNVNQMRWRTAVSIRSRRAKSWTKKQTYLAEHL
jgi:hypothetical protein